MWMFLTRTNYFVPLFSFVKKVGYLKNSLLESDVPLCYDIHVMEPHALCVTNLLMSCEASLVLRLDYEGT